MIILHEIQNLKTRLADTIREYKRLETLVGDCDELEELDTEADQLAERILKKKNELRGQLGRKLADELLEGL